MARVVAVVGASADRSKFSNKAVRAFRHHGDEVVPIHPSQPEIEGLKAYRSVLDVPGRIDMATFYVPPAVGEGLIEEVARKGIREVWLNPGADSDALAERAQALDIRAVRACSILGIGESPSDY